MHAEITSFPTCALHHNIQNYEVKVRPQRDFQIESHELKHKQCLIIVPKHSESPPLEAKCTLHPQLLTLPSNIGL